MIVLRSGTADDTDRNTLAACINIANEIATLVECHRHALPDIRRAADACNAGWHDADTIDRGIEIYKTLVKTTPRATVIRAIAATLKHA